MFSVQHIIWMVISAAIIAGLVIALAKKRPPLKSVLTSAFVICVLSELTKVLSCIELVPSTDGNVLYPYLELQHLPFHLCSIQILMILYCRFAKGDILKSPGKQYILRFMYPTCVIGAAFALILPSIFSTTITVNQAFTHPIAYQTFIYHAMLIAFGVYIPMSGEVSFSWKTYRKTMLFLGLITFMALYLNSLFASVTYQNGKLVSVDYVTNFFFVYKTPIGLALNTKLAWLIYLLIIVALAFVLIWLLYLPLKKTKCWNNDTKEEK